MKAFKFSNFKLKILKYFFNLVVLNMSKKVTIKELTKKKVILSRFYTNLRANYIIFLLFSKLQNKLKFGGIWINSKMSRYIAS